MNLRHGGMILTRETEVLREKPIPVPLSSPHIPHSWTAVTNCLCHSTAMDELLINQNTMPDGHVTSSDKAGPSKPSL